MQRRIDATKQVAKDYIDGVPEEDAVLLASFDETFVLRGPLGMDRETIKDRVESLRLGFSTGLWDALHRLALYLDTVHGEKVVILLTDGEDSSSVDSTGTQALALVRHFPDLVVFPIGIALSPDANAAQAIARSQLAVLARTTGGRFFETQTADGLPRIFREIRKRLLRRVFLSYIPGEPAARRPEHPRIRATLPPSVPCRIRILGPPQLEGRRRTALANESKISRIEARADGEGIVGQVDDLLLERGPLFTSRSIREGRPRLTLDRHPEFEVRDFEVLTPPVREVVRALDTPERLLLYLLEHAPPSPARGPDDSGVR